MKDNYIIAIAIIAAIVLLVIYREEITRTLSQVKKQVKAIDDKLAHMESKLAEMKTPMFEETKPKHYGFMLSKA